MNEAELFARNATETSLSRASAAEAVPAVFSTFDDALASRETHRIAGFGIFSTRSWTAREGRNLRPRAKASPLTPRRRLSSRPARPSMSPSTSSFGEYEYRCHRTDA